MPREVGRAVEAEYRYKVLFRGVFYCALNIGHNLSHKSGTILKKELGATNPSLLDAIGTLAFLNDTTATSLIEARRGTAFGTLWAHFVAREVGGC